MQPVRLLPVAVAIAFSPAGAGAQVPTALPHTSLFQSLPVHRPAPSWPAAPAAGLSPGLQCRAAIASAEQTASIPHQLMAAIGRVESGRAQPDGTIDPWPWSINAEGQGHVYDTKAEAIAAVQALQTQGVKSIDVGCMQVNLMYHPDAFPNLEQAFDPVANANYAARFLLQLRDQTGTWPTATAWYHSATPELGADYQRRVMAVWPEEQRRKDTPGPMASSYASGYANGFSGGYANTFANGYASGFSSPFGQIRSGGNVLFPVRAEPAHIIPLPAGTVGRSLAAYRAAPIPVASPPPATIPARAPGNPG